MSAIFQNGDCCQMKNSTVPRNSSELSNSCSYEGCCVNQVIWHFKLLLDASPCVSVNPLVMVVLNRDHVRLVLM